MYYEERSETISEFKNRFSLFTPVPLFFFSYVRSMVTMKQAVPLAKLLAGWKINRLAPLAPPLAPLVVSLFRILKSFEYILKT